MNPRSAGLFAAIIAVAAFIGNKNVDWHHSVTNGNTLPPVAQLILFTLILAFWPVIIAAGIIYRKKKPKTEKIGAVAAAKAVGLISLWLGIEALSWAWQIFVLLGVFGLLVFGVKVLLG